MSDLQRFRDLGTKIGALAGEIIALASEVERLKKAVQPTPSRDREAMEFFRFCDDAIGLFLEYRDQHGCNEIEARAKAMMEVQEAILKGADDG